MKKKMLVIPVFLLAFALISLPVMATPTKKVPVTATQIGITTGFVFHTVLKGNRVVTQIREGVGTSVMTLNLPGGPIDGTGTGDVQGKILFWNPPPDPETVGIWQAHMVWTFDEGEGKTGTFEGVRKSKVMGYPAALITTYLETSCVLHGTGDFLGQTLKLSYEGDGGRPIDWEGTLLTPK